MKLNCDLGEGYGNYACHRIDAIMPYLHQANIACGYHAGDHFYIPEAIELARKHHVEIGAHPSYPDRAGFGRRHMTLSSSELFQIMTFQIATLDGLCQRYDATLSYVKPHGALYHDMVNDKRIRDVCLDAISRFVDNQNRPKLFCVLPAILNPKPLVDSAEQYGLQLQFEAFADRAYADNGQLLSRAEQGAILKAQAALSQAKMLIQSHHVITPSNRHITLHADTLCVHGDHPESETLVKSLYKLVNATSRQ